MSKRAAPDTLTLDQISKRVKKAVSSSIPARPNGKVGVAVITTDFDGYKEDENKKWTERMNFAPTADRLAKLFEDKKEGYGYDVYRLVLESGWANPDLEQGGRDSQTHLALEKAAA